MFIPLHDRNKLDYIEMQYVTLGLIGLNIVIWLVMALGGQNDETIAAAVLGLGYIPAVANDFADLPSQYVLVPEPATYLTYAFLHGNFLHLAGNMLFLWVFGDNVEDALGHVRFLIFYCLCAVAGAFAHGLVVPHSEMPLIGASGAVAGIVAAYLMLHPRVRLWILAFGRIPLPLPAYVPLSLWIIVQIIMVIRHSDDQISWGAHIGGLIAGAVLVVFLRRGGVPLFDTRLEPPDAVVLKENPGKTGDQHWGR